jgi:hypothetical protein
MSISDIPNQLLWPCTVQPTYNEVDYNKKSVKLNKLFIAIEYISDLVILNYEKKV